MRARKKKNTVPRLERVSDYFVPVIPAPEGEIRVEVGCGKGKFITAWAKDHPEITFYALEKIPDVIVMAAEKAAREEIGNVKFLLADAKDLTEGTEKTFLGLDENRQPSYKPYDKKTRIKAWIGIAAMIALTLGYFYVFYSGIIIKW